MDCLKLIRFVRHFAIFRLSNCTLFPRVVPFIAEMPVFSLAGRSIVCSENDRHDLPPPWL
jgi:hypothetical protein